MNEKTGNEKTGQAWYRYRLGWQFGLLGMGSGLPLLLIFSSLSLWLKYAGIDKAQITFFAWAGLGYGFKFLWAPLIDQLDFPWLSHWRGQRRGWLLATQIAVMLAIIGMGLTDPSEDGGSRQMAMMAVLLGFCSASQDIVIDGLRIDSDRAEQQALLSSFFIAGYRVGMVLAGAGVLKIVAYLGGDTTSTGGASLSYHYGDWRFAWLIMAAVMIIPIIIGQTLSEPSQRQDNQLSSPSSSTPSLAHQVKFLMGFVIASIGFVLIFRLGGDWFTPAKGAGNLLNFGAGSAQLLLALSAGVIIFYGLVRLGLVDRALCIRSFRDPLTQFLSRFKPWQVVLLLLTISCYRLSDVVMGTVANLFYTDKGYSLDEIADYSKTYGIIVTIAGGFMGGWLCKHWGVWKVLWIGAVLASASNFLFSWLASLDRNLYALMTAIVIDNLAAGLAATAFVAFLSALTQKGFSASQYALFTSLMVILPKLISGYSGSMVNQIGYGSFFSLTAVVGIPVIIVIIFLGRSLMLTSGQTHG